MGDEGYDGTSCQNETPCPDTCSQHGVPTGTLAQDNCDCECDAGWSGSDCSTPIACPARNCSSHGSTVGTIPEDNCACACDHGWTGDSCENPVPCDPQTFCNGNGFATGMLHRGDCKCYCQQGYTGASCRDTVSCPCCMNGGSPTGSASEGTCGCTCPSGFDGARCEIPNNQWNYCYANAWGMPSMLQTGHSSNTCLLSVNRHGHKKTFAAMMQHNIDRMKRR